MIVELRVRDLATIEDVTLPLGPGLNILTGETGAGKSILVDAIALLLGARGDPGAVRDGSSRLVVEGAFEGLDPELAARMDQHGLSAEGEALVLRREVSAEGRSRGWVNGSPVTMATLASLGELLVDLHGQHETRTLLQPDRQREVLDTFGDALPEAEEVANRAAEVASLEREEAELQARRDGVRRRADYLRHLVEEIEAAKLVPGEDGSLDVEARRLSQAGTLSDLARRIADLIEGEDEAALSAMAAADRALATLERADSSVAPWHELLDPAFAQLQELARVAT
ncbi:MAG: AAA family ATPase, partial [Gemmatimonadota bacterium]